jgi:hypothetical protein
VVVAPNQPNTMDDMHIHRPLSSSWTMYLIISQGGIQVKEVYICEDGMWHFV